MAVKVLIAKERAADTVVLKLVRDDDGDVSVVSLDPNGNIDNYIVNFVNENDKLSLHFSESISDGDHFNLDDEGEIEIV